MKINSININQINFSKPVLKNTAFPAFKSQLSTDVFVKETDKTGKVAEKSQSKQTLPKYLYHLTSENNYKKIMQSGQINMSKDIMDGVYLFDMDDFQKNWITSPNYNNTGTMAQALLEHTLKFEKGLVLLKIPTACLDEDKFAIRPEDEVVEFVNSQHFRNLATVYAEKGGILNNKWELPKYMVEGYSPSDAKKFAQEGRAIEYIYKGNIDISKAGVEKALEFPMLTRNIIWGFGKNDFAKLYDSFHKSTLE